LGGTEGSRRPSRSFLLLGAINNYPAVRSRTILVNQVKARENGSPSGRVVLDVRAVATAVPVRSRDAKPVGKKGCKIAGKGCDWRAQSALRTPDDRSKKNRIAVLGARPRAAATHMGTTSPALRGAAALLPPLAAAPCTETGVVDIEPGVFPDRWWFADTAGWHAGVASDERPRGTRGYSTWLGDKWDESPSRIP